MKKDLIITRVVAAVLAFAMFATQLSETMPVFYVCAEGEAETEYSIEHKVNSSWDGGCNAEFILKNLSNTGTKDWSISFSTTDVITDIWGGTITECREVSDENTTTGLEHYYRYTVKAESYTASIPSGAQVNIGYTALGDIHDIWDTEAELVSDDTEAGSGSNGEGDTTPIGGTYIGEGYTIDVIVADTWEGAYNVKLQIRNTSGEKIHNWGLIMKTTDRISGLYNAVELSDNDGLRLIKNAGYDQDIPAGGSVEIGYTAFYNGKADVPKEFALSQVKKEADMAECAVSLFITDEWEEGGMAQIIIENTSDSPIEDWSLEFDSTMDIANLWGGVIEKHEAGHYCIGNVDYAQNIAVGESWAITIVFNGKAADIQNIKVSQIVVVDGNLPDMPTPSPDKEEDIDLETDTDEDGIPDAYEEMIGTDSADSDTDKDGLDDYTEVFVLRSDPLVYDSIMSGISDGDADSDNDGLSNITELRLDLNLTFRDTDCDGLDDGDEINLYGTDPGNEDTDGDGLKDGEEVRLGLDPLRSCTYGVDDSRYRIKQTIDKESEAFIRINKEDNPYRFSMDIIAAGFVEDNIDVCEPMEAAVIQNDAMIGMPVHMYYDRAESIESVTLRFEINDEYVIDKSTRYPDISELKGVHRYNVFHYFEDRNMLLPVETFFDEENNTVYAKTDELGTYCLMDMEKVFDRLNSLSERETEKDDISGISIPEISQQAETAETQMTALEFAKEMSEVAAAKPDGVSDIPITKALPEGDGRKLVNLYFILFHAGESDWIYNKERNMIPDVLERLQNNNKDYKFRALVIDPDNSWVMYNFGGGIPWYDDPEELRNMLEQTDRYEKYNGYIDYDEAGSALHSLLKKQIKENPDSLNFAYNCTSTHMWCSRHISRPYSIYEDFAGKVVYSDIGKYIFQYEDYDEASEYPTFVEKTGGKRWICEGDMVSKVYEHIVGILSEISEGGSDGNEPIPTPSDGGEDLPEPEAPKEKELVNLVFALQTSGSDENLFNEQVRMIPELLEKLQNEHKEYQYRVSVLASSGEGDSDILLNIDDTMWFNDVQILRNSLSSLTYKETKEIITLAEMFNMLSWLMEGVSENRNYVFLLHSGDIEKNLEMANPNEICTNYLGKINYSELGNKTNYWEGEDPTRKTGGKSWIYYDGMNMVNMLYVHITRGYQQNIQPRKAYPAITLTGWNIIELDTELDASNGTDTDGDGLTDWDEVDTALLSYEDGEYKLPSLNDCINSVDKPYVKEGLYRFNSSVFKIAGNHYQITEIYRKTFVLPIRSNPSNVDSDGDGINDNCDKQPLLPNTVIVNLQNIYDMDYLNIDGKDGGDQGWWGHYDEDKELFYTSRDYRMGHCGCGVIAMTDLELYLTQQNSGYHAANHIISYNVSDGCIGKDDYMEYANYNIDNVYCLGPNLRDNIVGVNPGYMRLGIEMFLCENKSRYKSAAWAPSYTKYGIISRIETMVSKGLPVVFSYHAPDDPLFMYDTIDAAKAMIDKSNKNSCDDHYMTILGFIRYTKDNGENGYILKIISWGDIYYINYDQYSEKLGLFTNILEII